MPSFQPFDHLRPQRHHHRQLNAPDGSEASNRNYAGPDVVSMPFKLPTPIGPPQPQRISASLMIDPQEKTTTITTVFTEWEQWKGVPLLDMSQIKAVVSLTQRSAELVECPFDEDKVLIEKVTWTSKITHPNTDAIRISSFYVENDHLYHGHYNYNVFEGAPIILAPHTSCLDSMIREVERARLMQKMMQFKEEEQMKEQKETLQMEEEMRQIRLGLLDLKMETL